MAESEPKNTHVPGDPRKLLTLRLRASTITKLKTQIPRGMMQRVIEGILLHLMEDKLAKLTLPERHEAYKSLAARSQLDDQEGLRNADS